VVAIIQGERIGRTGKLAVGCEAAIFDESGERILIIRRRDNGMWCQPGGHIEPGESVAETCVREVKEETGLDVDVFRLVGIYSDPNRVAEYADGNRFHPIVLSFEARVIGGSLHDSDESSEMGFFTMAEIKGMDYMMPLFNRIEDAFARREAAFIR